MSEHMAYTEPPALSMQPSKNLSGLGDLSDYPRFEYSMKQVLRAGEALRGDLLWSPQTRDHVLEVFKISTNFRDAHAHPMRKIRLLVSARMKRLGLEGHTVARLKRMPSIRRKLQKHKGQLNQIQYLAGCRAILPSIADVDALVRELRSIPHELLKEDTYIQSPKSDGYRCHHMVFKFRGEDRDLYYDGRRVEVQIRTRLQHAWATAVEAVGFFRGENLKAGEGSSDWLSLLKLVSAEFALIERIPLSCNRHARSSLRSR